ncbi:hypothetical protein [Paraliomyxa miuraensis]|uniref:hypothetical protein n=1 Tax=Paraliomyxa miuraensis TaxID=376150 RepID=UPI002253D78C|nr:hypothetical protein [Paraliomyxa miuraensis]MCX4241585.1 hypothetical protein [Paraliomyxa miuraensis]
MSWLRTLPLLVSVLGLGCFSNTVQLETDPDPGDGSGNDSTSDTMDGTGDTTVSDTGMPMGPQTYLMAYNSSWQPGLPFQAVVTATPGSGTVDLTLQWLSLDIGSTTAPRQPVGDVYAYAGVPVDAATGTFYWDTGIILIPGAANPITGADVVASIQLNAVPAGTPAYCGAAGGTVLMPVELSLDGSSHGMNVISDVGNLPIEFFVACP